MVGNTNQKETLFCHDVFAILQLEDEFPRRYSLTYGIPYNARLFEQFAAGRVRKALPCLQRTAWCRPIILAGEGPRSNWNRNNNTRLF